MSPRLQVLVPPELDAQICKAARRSRVSKGEWVRRALKESLRQAGNVGHANPMARMASLNSPAASIDQVSAEIETGRRWRFWLDDSPCMSREAIIPIGNRRGSSWNGCAWASRRHAESWDRVGGHLWRGVRRHSRYSPIEAI